MVKIGISKAEDALAALTCFVNLRHVPLRRTSLQAASELPEKWKASSKSSLKDFERAQHLRRPDLRRSTAAWPKRPSIS